MWTPLTCLVIHPILHACSVYASTHATFAFSSPYIFPFSLHVTKHSTQGDNPIVLPVQRSFTSSKDPNKLTSVLSDIHKRITRAIFTLHPLSLQHPRPVLFLEFVYAHVYHVSFGELCDCVVLYAVGLALFELLPPPHTHTHTHTYTPYTYARIHTHAREHMRRDGGKHGSTHSTSVSV